MDVNDLPFAFCQSFDGNNGAISTFEPLDIHFVQTHLFFIYDICVFDADCVDSIFAASLVTRFYPHIEMVAGRDTTLCEKMFADKHVVNIGMFNFRSITETVFRRARSIFYIGTGKLTASYCHTTFFETRWHMTEHYTPMMSYCVVLAPENVDDNSMDSCIPDCMTSVIWCFFVHGSQVPMSVMPRYVCYMLIHQMNETIIENDLYKARTRYMSSTPRHTKSKRLDASAMSNMVVAELPVDAFFDTIKLFLHVPDKLIQHLNVIF